MKKTIFSLTLCLLMSAGAVMAQDRRNSGNNQRRAPQQMDAVVDTAVLNKMELEPQLLTQILELQTTKQAEQKATLEAEKQSRTGADGKRQKLTDEQREARRQEQEAFTAGYRSQLRTLMGDALYIAYLERLVDARGMMRMPVRNNQNSGNQRGGDMPGGDMPGGGFGGGFGGGDF
jgi:hypothetical protein